jgi:hypothetical protein
MRDTTICKCSTKVRFEVDGGELYSIEFGELNACGGSADCLESAYIPSIVSMENGIYVGVMESKCYETFNGEETEYDGESTITHIEFVEAT